MRDLVEALVAALIIAAIVIGLGLLAKYVIGPVVGDFVCEQVVCR